MKNIILGLILILPALSMSAVPQTPFTSDNTDLLDLLDNELALRDSYVAQRRQRIDSLNQLILADSVPAPERIMELGVLVGALDVDSAIMAFTRANELSVAAGDSVMAQRSLLYRSEMMSRLGATSEAINDLKNVAEHGIFTENRALYCEIGRDLYYTHAELFEGSNAHDSYMLPGVSLARQYQSLLSSDSYAYKLNRALIFFAEGNDSMFLAHLSEIAKDIDSGEPMYSYVMTAFGGRLLLIGRHEEAIRYLALAAINDVRNADKTNTALIRLGCALYNVRDLARAHGYLSVALDDALAAGAKTNSLLISSALMPVGQDLRKRDENKMVLLGFLTASLVVVVLMLGRLYQSKRRRARDMERVKHQLANANLSKDTYISEFMNLCSSYMESLEDFNRMCRRKITAGQSDDLLSVIKSGKIMEEQRKKFDDIFDDSFLAIYTTFIEDVNRLLLPDKQIVTPDKNVLTTELRVLAFTRLGVDDTAQVARFLGVTLNTVYTYRNKLRNKAISRDTFDSDVMKIGVID